MGFGLSSRLVMGDSCNRNARGRRRRRRRGKKRRREEREEDNEVRVACIHNKCSDALNMGIPGIQLLVILVIVVMNYW